MSKQMRWQNPVLECMPLVGFGPMHEQLEWSPNHRPEFRTIQFSVDVRDAFGRDDIQSVGLVLSTPSGTNTVFDKEFEDDDLRLDNNGLLAITLGHMMLE